MCFHSDKYIQNYEAYFSDNLFYFQKKKSNNRTLIWGEAGVRKTTFCHKISQDWALNITGRSRSEQDKLTEDQERLLSNIDLIAHIVLRDTTQSQTLEEILQSQLFGPIKSKPIDILDYRNVILLCDGLDEVSFESGPILDVVYAKCYPGLKIIVTCRPHAALGISLTTDSEIRLKGFNMAQAKHYVDMYFHKKFSGTPKVAQSKSNKAWKQIESSADLLEMSTNPSMLQLMCLIYCETGRMGKDRATLFRDYTFYLLNQYHLKSTGKTEATNTLNQIYKDTLIKIGHLALQGLQQSHLQLVFTKEEVMECVGDVIFKMGFLTEIPSFDQNIRKVQFLHKTLQEYLAAYAVVHSSNQEGLQLLMKFCSTSQGLMGSQMILTFITAMSKKMGKVIQRKIQDFVSSWTSDDDISPKDRVSFLITMLKENKSLEFPLPETIHINLKEYETFMGGLNQAILHLFNRKTTIERFFSMDSRGVKYIELTVGKSNRLELLKTVNLEEIEVDFEKTYSKGDERQIINIIKTNKNLSSFNMSRMTGPFTLINNQEFIQITSLFQKLRVYIENADKLIIDEEKAEFICKIPENVQLTLSESKIVKIHKESLKRLILKLGKGIPKYIDESGLGIEIDTELVKCISELPKDVQIDLSGNKITKMEAGLLGKALKYMKKQEKIGIGGWEITIDVDIVKALSNMVYLKYLRLSYNTLTPPAGKCLSQSVRSLPQLEYLGLGYCDISNDDCVDLVSSLSKHCPRLRELHLHDNYLSSGYSQVVDDVSKMNNLWWLELWGNPCMKDRKKREEVENRLKISNPQLTVYTGL